MPSLPTHLIVGAALGQAASAKSRINWKLRFAAVACSAIPDLDVIGFHFGVRYGDFWGHRGFTHSLLFAALLGVAAGCLLGGNLKERFFASVLLVMVAASHGLLDAMTNGGLGVALFSPFDTHRYFFCWRPVQVSPIGLNRFGPSGWRILTNEAKYVWLPAIAVGLILYAIRHLTAKDAGDHVA